MPEQVPSDHAECATHAHLFLFPHDQELIHDLQRLRKHCYSFGRINIVQQSCPDCRCHFGFASLKQVIPSCIYQLFFTCLDQNIVKLPKLAIAPIHSSSRVASSHNAINVTSGHWVDSYSLPESARSSLTLKRECVLMAGVSTCFSDHDCDRAQGIIDVVEAR